MPKYANNPLTHAIIKVNFNNKFPIDDNLPKDILDAAKKEFPLFEPMPISHSQIKISAEGAKVTNVDQSTNWIFYGINREKVLIITSEGSDGANTSIAIDYLKYESFDASKSEFISIFNKFVEVFPESKIGRVGLRYVNKIELKERNPLNWSKYINANLLNGFKFADDRKFISRAFNNLELKYDDMNIKFQYGMHNPDYPSPIKKKIFTLDYDVYYMGECDKSNVMGAINKYHDKIISLFESSIKDGLRDKLNE